MPLYEGVPTIWMRSVRWHTYDAVPQPPGARYLAHAYQVENVERVLKFAVREEPPTVIAPPIEPEHPAHPEHPDKPEKPEKPDKPPKGTP